MRYVLERDRNLREQLLLYRQRMLERMNSVCDDIARTVASIPPERLYMVTADGESPHRILAFLRDVESRAFSIRMHRILEEEEPFLPLFDEKKWMEEHYDPVEPPENILAEYIAFRNNELAWLNNLSIEAWNRTGRHPWWGVRSLQWWVEQTLRFSEEQLTKLKTASIS